MATEKLSKGFIRSGTDHHWGDPRGGPQAFLPLSRLWQASVPTHAAVSPPPFFFRSFQQKTVRGGNLRPLPVIAKNNLSGALFPFDYSKTGFSYSCFILQTQLEDQQEMVLE